MARETATVSPSTVTSAQPCLYSNANLNAIVAQPPVTETPPASAGAASTINNYNFPAQSITLFIMPGK